MITSKLTSKAPTTIPQPLRAALGLREGDGLAYNIEAGRVVLTRARAEAPQQDPLPTFMEWNADADRAAYDGL